ncbi:MAG: FAD-dependent oxidoreductase, partial [Myxococcota bacterium]
MHRKDLVVAREHERIAQNLLRHGIELVRGEASFQDARNVRVRGTGDAADRVLAAEVVLIAVGSRPARPSGIAFEADEILDSDEVLALDRVPRSLCVVGAGVVGCEYASIFAALGVEVTLCDGRDRLLPFLDHEIADALLAQMRTMMTVVLGAPVERVAATGGGAKTTLRAGQVIESERVLVAAGRVGNTETLRLENAGLAADARGLLCVDEHFRTAAPGVYAAGDVIGNPALASASMEQGRVAICHAFDLAYKQRVSPLLPYGIYTLPEVSSVGETEESARAKGLDCETGRAGFAQNARAMIQGDTAGLLKIVFRRGDRRLLGAHVVGEGACETIHVALAYLQQDAPIDAFIDAVFNYPSICEAYKYAAYDGLARLARSAASGR